MNNKINESSLDLIEIPIDKRDEVISDLLKEVPYSLSVALIKVSEIQNYIPLPLEKYYNNILPAFHLLRRNDGSKYKITSINTVRSAMVSNRLYSKNEEGLYVLNKGQAINLLRLIKTKNTLNENEVNDYDSDSESNLGKKTKREEKKENVEEEENNGIEKYQKIFNLLSKLLKISLKDKNLKKQLKINLEEIDKDNIDNIFNIDKIVGMLTAFRFFKPFLEKSLFTNKIQKHLNKKMTELKSELELIEQFFNAD